MEEVEKNARVKITVSNECCMGSCEIQTPPPDHKHFELGND
jgi:hypothetical protein